MTLPPVLAVTGLSREAKLAAGPDVIAVAAGGSQSRLQTLLSEAPPCRAVISFGIAGGLDPALTPGSIVVARAIVAHAQAWPAHRDITQRWMTHLERAREPALVADVAALDAPLLTASGKAALRAATGAAAIDMESHVAAEFAVTRRVPFAAIRVVCDPATRSLPPLVGEALRPDGRIDLAAILHHLARRPGQIAALPRLARDAAAAFAALGRVRAALGPGLGLRGLSLGEPLGDVL